MKKFIAGVVSALALAGAVGLYAAATVERITVIPDYVNGIRINGVGLSQDGVTTLANDTEINDTVGEGTVTIHRVTSGTVTITADDDDANAALTIKPGGTGALTLGGASSGAVRVNSGTLGTITMGRSDSGVVTVTAADDDATAALTVKPGGAAAMILGGASMTALTVTTDSTGTAEVVLPNASIDGLEMANASAKITFCGQLAENGAIYFAPTAPTSAEPALADATCDGNDNATEATADAPLSASAIFYAKSMFCISNATLGAGETIVYQLRSAEASVSGVTCTMAVGETTCEVHTPTAAGIAAAATAAMLATETSNNADDDAKCVVYGYFK